MRGCRGLAVGLVAASTLVLALDAAPASAACGGVKRHGPLKRVAPGRAPLAIGDSVMLGAVREVASVGYEVNVRGCRPMGEGLRLMRARKRGGRLPTLVVLALGANAPIRSPEVRAAVRIMGRDRYLGLVTPREAGGRSGSGRRVIRAAGRRYGDRVKVLDWVAYSAGHGGWFAGDGLHLGPGGARGLARLLSRATPLADPLRDRWRRSDEQQPSERVVDDPPVSPSGGAAPSSAAAGSGPLPSP